MLKTRVVIWTYGGIVTDVTTPDDPDSLEVIVVDEKSNGNVVGYDVKAMSSMHWDVYRELLKEAK